MKNNYTDWFYLLLKTLADIILLSVVQTIFKSSMEITEKTRRALLLSTVFMIVINILGIYRNSFTLWKYQDFMSYFLLGSDIMQLLLCGVIWASVYINDTIGLGLKRILVIASLIFCGLNIYNFLVNFKWLQIEGLHIFLFWFINNGASVVYHAATAYLLYAGYKLIVNQKQGA